MRPFPGKATAARAISSLAVKRARCVFVLSTGRVGTVTLTKLLELSKDVWAEHEPGPQLLRVTKALYEESPPSPQAASEFCRAFAASRVRGLMWAARRGRVYAETSNRLTLAGHLLVELLPRARFIHLHRDPAAIVASGMSRRWYDGHPWDEFRIAPRSDAPAASQWPMWDCFQKSCWYWNAMNEVCLEIGQLVSEKRFMQLSTDQLFAPDNRAIGEIFDWLGVRRPPAEVVDRIASIRFNANAGDRFPPWEAWPEERREFLARIAGETARLLGYARYGAAPVRTGSAAPRSLPEQSSSLPEQSGQS